MGYRLQAVDARQAARDPVDSDRAKDRIDPLSARAVHALSRRMPTFVLAGACALLAATGSHAAPGSPIPSFEATALSGEKVTDAALVGQPTILIVTPSKAAAEDTRQWAVALRENLDEKSIRVRDVLAVDLPFFMSEADAIGRAKEKIPARYHDQTWILAETSLETALGIPTNSASAFVIALDSQGQIIARVAGGPTEQRIEQIRAAARSLK